MSEAEYPCLLGLNGECQVMRRLAEWANRTAQQLQYVRPALPESGVKRELEAFWAFLSKELLRIFSTPTHMASSVGPFCLACVRVKELRGELRRIPGE